MESKIKTFVKSLERNFLSDKASCEIKFRIAFGRKIDWKNPTGFGEKIQWRKIYDRNPLYTLAADRFEVRKYVEKKIGKKYLIPLLFSGKPNELKFENLKPPFVIKTNHNVGKHYFVRDSEDYKKINQRKLLDYFSNCLKKDWSKFWREWHYKNIKPLLVVEKILLEKGKIPHDYKFHCFNGRVEMVQVDMGRFENHTRCILNRKGDTLPFAFGPDDGRGNLGVKMVSTASKPKNFQEMISVAERLSKDFDYVRVDLYSLKNRIYFGELTITPCAGFERFEPKEWDYYFGKLWEIKR